MTPNSSRISGPTKFWPPSPRVKINSLFVLFRLIYMLLVVYFHHLDVRQYTGQNLKSLIFEPFHKYVKYVVFVVFVPLLIV